MRGRAVKYGRKLDQAQRARLYRLRQAGVVTDETTPDEVVRLLQQPPKFGKRPAFPGMTKAQREKLVRKTGKTITQLARELEQ